MRNEIPEPLKTQLETVDRLIWDGRYADALRLFKKAVATANSISVPLTVATRISEKIARIRYLYNEVLEPEGDDRQYVLYEDHSGVLYGLEGAVIPFRPTGRALRDVTLTGAERLLTWDTGRKDRRGQTIIGYAFWPSYKNPGKPLFHGADFAGSPLHADNSDETLRALLGFLTLRPGDTDRDYFDGYTDEQMAYAQGDAEYHQQWTDEEFAPPFIDRKKLAGRIGPL